MNESMRAIPAVDRVLREAQIVELQRCWAPELIKAWVAEAVDELRARILAGAEFSPAEGLAQTLTRVIQRAESYRRPYHRRIINATGILAHTGLGRAPLARQAAEALREAAGAALVEVDQASGKRGVREEQVAELLCHLCGAAAATVVNNNAAATLVALKALSEGRETVVSRGELVEIGGSFRMPDVMEQGGVILREVGTTNRTRLSDYERVIGERTGLLLKVHRSNFRIQGFSESVSLEKLVGLGHRYRVPVIEDLGGGLLLGDRRVLPDEPRVRDSAATGADLVCFSGDKLLGGPQAGILIGRREAVARVRAHPLFRALRPGKLTLSALEATLRIYLEGEGAARERIPLLRGLCLSLEEVERRARAWLQRLREQRPELTAEIAPAVCYAGSGAAPLEELPSRAVVLGPLANLDALARRLRLGDPGLHARVEGARIWLDFRTLEPGDEEAALQCVLKACS